jgi:hypothetical protein
LAAASGRPRREFVYSICINRHFWKDIADLAMDRIDSVAVFAEVAERGSFGRRAI